MAKVHQIITTIKRVKPQKNIPNNIPKLPQFLKANLKTLKQFQPQEDVVEISNSFSKTYNDYKNLENTNSIMSFERKKLAQIEDNVSQGFFRDEELFDETRELTERIYDIDDIPVFKRTTEHFERIDTEFYPNTNINNSLKHKLARIAMGDKLDAEATKFNRTMTLKMMPKVAEEALSQLDRGIPEKQMLQNYKHAFLKKHNPNDKNFSLELFHFLSTKPKERESVIIRNALKEEEVDLNLLEYFPKINALLKDEKSTAKALDDCVIDGVRDPLECQFAEFLCKIYGKWDNSMKKLLDFTVFETKEGKKSSRQAVSIVMDKLRQNQWSVDKTLNDSSLIRKYSVCAQKAQKSQDVPSM